MRLETGRQRRLSCGDDGWVAARRDRWECAGRLEDNVGSIAGTMDGPLLGEIDGNALEVAGTMNGPLLGEIAVNALVNTVSLAAGRDSSNFYI